MQADSYERPGVEDQTSVTEPLNTIINSEGGGVLTPAWRSRAAGDEPAAEAYEAPRVDEHTPVSEPLNTGTLRSVPLPETPVWRRKDNDR